MYVGCQSETQRRRSQIVLQAPKMGPVSICRIRTSVPRREYVLCGGSVGGPWLCQLKEPWFKSHLLPCGTLDKFLYCKSLSCINEYLVKEISGHV